MTTPIVALGDVLADIRPGFASGDNLVEGVFQIRMNNLSREGDLLLDERRRVSPHSKQITRSLLQPGDVLFNATNSPELVGKTAIFLGCDEPAVFSNHFVRLRTREHQLDARYLTRWLQRKFQRGYFRAKCKQWVNQATFGQDRLVKMQIPLPSIEAQRRIASVLDAAEALRGKRRQALSWLDSLTQAIFVNMFGANGWDAWETSPVADLAASTKGSIRTGPFGSQLLHEEFEDEGPVAVLGIDNAVNNHFTWGERRFISADKYAELKRYTVRPGDVLITIMGTCGRTAIVPDDIRLAINTKHLCCITLDRDRCLPEFLWACLRFHPGVMRQLGATRGAVMPGLNMGIIKRAEVPLPPIEVQKRFARSKENADQQVASSATHLSRLDELFASLQQRAFRGEL